MLNARSPGPRTSFLVLAVLLVHCPQDGAACVKKKFYKDLDGDGYGDPNNWTRRCREPRNHPWTRLDKATDCNDSSAGANIGAVEVCDGIDNDCDGQVDEGVMSTFYADVDGDGFGDSNDSIEGCEPVPQGFVKIGGDCAPQNPDVHPNATEIVDGVDNNCSGSIDDIKHDVPTVASSDL